MTTPIVELKNVTRKFGWGQKQISAVDSLSLTIQPHQVFGLLGPNGAGKSTTLRMLLGLIHPSSGDIKIFGQPLERAGNLLRQKVGALVEHAALYPYLSGRQNLIALAKYSGCYDAQRIDALLDLVNMTEEADRKTATYSTGMQQRIGIAAALLNDPELIILDEPTNGLDPQGIHEIRGIIRRMVDDMGKTVILSSHLLSEVERVADYVAIIHRGRLVKEGAVADLLTQQGRIRMEVHPIEKARQVLEPAYPYEMHNGWLDIHAEVDNAPALARQMMNAGVDIRQIHTTSHTLEDIFLQATEAMKDNQHD